MKLALDTSSNKVAISIENKGLVYTKYSKEDFSQAEEIAVLLQELCAENNFLLQDIKKIYCVIGPGSFTAIRVLVAFVKGFTLGSDIKIFPITKFYYLLANVIGKTNSDLDFEVLIDCRKDKKEFFYQKISSNFILKGKPLILSYENFEFDLKKNLIISDYNLSEKFGFHKNFFHINSKDLKIEEIFRLPDIIYYYKLEPLYVREPYVR
jgi:tRNA threonylcarbamoyl adenosine modification protein YeaZ